MSKDFPFYTLLTWYKQHGRHTLPWRQVYDEPVESRLYKIWVSEVMLQQTQVDRVKEYYTRFLRKYPTIHSLAETTYEELFPYYQGLGYYGRARRMIELAKIVVQKHGGVFPEDYNILRTLPGIGEYTTQALLAFGYDKPALAIDANLKKIFARYYFGDRTASLPEKLIEDLVRQLNSPSTFPLPLRQSVSEASLPSTPSSFSCRDINNALMDFGALVSTTFNAIDHDEYPLKNCQWFLTGGKKEQKKRSTINDKQKENSKYKTRNTEEVRHGTKKKKEIVANSPLSDHREEEGVGGVNKIKQKRHNNKRLSRHRQGGTINKHSCLVFLHENHKKYWSSHPDRYEPFLIASTLRDDRTSIQDYFQATYGLEVSVRPSFGKGIFLHQHISRNEGIGSRHPRTSKCKLCGTSEDPRIQSQNTFDSKYILISDIPVKLFHAQIQTGKHTFREYEPHVKEEFLEKLNRHRVQVQGRK